DIQKDILADEKYKYLFTVDLVNQYVMEGLPFRDAYLKVGRAVEDGTYAIPQADPTKNSAAHKGSIHNLCTAEIKLLMEKAVADFGFERIHTALGALLHDS